MVAALLLLMTAAPAPEWCPLSEGVEYRAFAFAPGGELHVVRIDPKKAQLAFALASRDGGKKRTAAQWAEANRFSATINAGMFDTDHKSNVGRLVDGEHVNRSRWNDYRSVLVFKPNDAKVLDVDTDEARKAAEAWPSNVQNLRLIKGAGTSVWKPNGRAWSESAIAEDGKGRILFLYSDQGVEMAKWNDAVLAISELDVKRAMHVEGGPEASLSLRWKKPSDAPACAALKKASGRLDFAGSFETGFFERGSNDTQWELPNVIGVRMR